MKKVSKKKVAEVSVEEMKEMIFDNMFGAYLDDGIDEMEAEESAMDYVNSLTKKEIQNEYKEMVS